MRSPVHPFFVSVLSGAIFLLLSLSASAQHYEQRFKAGAFLGFNAGQIDGDDHQGYRKLGLLAGLRGATVLGDRFELDTELSFSQRGSKSSKGSGGSLFSGGAPDRGAFDLSLSYVEAAFLLNYLTYETYYDYYAIHLHGGLSYGRLIGSEVQETTTFKPEVVPMNVLKPWFTKNDINLILGASVYVTENLGLTLRHSVELTPLFDPERHPDVASTRLMQYFLSVSVVYMVF